MAHMFFAQAMQMDTFAQQKTFCGAIACTLLDSPYVIELYFPMIGEKIKTILCNIDAKNAWSYTFTYLYNFYNNFALFCLIKSTGVLL